MRLRWARILSLPLALLVLATGPVCAKGGAAAYTRLLVGARPMGMGGAFTGLADDVTATFFNPAGISALRQREVTAMHAALSFDRNFNYIAGAFPNHKGDSAWGVSYTRFSIDGIPETRLADAVNPVTNPDGTVTIFSLFDDVEDNFAVQYGWKINDQLRLGAAARLHHRDLFGREANGFGTDFGALWQATRDVRLGFSLRHIFEHIRENTTQHRDDVPFLATMGLAVRGWKDTMWVLDIFAEESDGFGVRGGVEKWWNDHYALRTGYNDGEFSVGASARYQKFQFDYAFQTEDIGDVNRVSMIYRF
jgi:hypothetical protein